MTGGRGEGRERGGGESEVGTPWGGQRPEMGCPWNKQGIILTSNSDYARVIHSHVN